MCDKNTINDLYAKMPNFNKMAVNDAISFLEWFFDREISNVSAKKFPDVGGPIDILVMTPERQYFAKVKDSSIAII